MVLLGGTQVPTPPEPRAVVLVPRAEDDGSLALPVRRKGGQKGTDPTHPYEERGMALATGKHRAHHFSGGGVPRVAASERVARVPADGHDATAGHLRQYLLSHQREGDTVEVYFTVHLYAAKFKSHDGRQLSAGLLRIAPAGLPFPSQAVESVVLMTEHGAFLPQRPQSVDESLTLGGLPGHGGDRHQGECCQY